MALAIGGLVLHALLFVVLTGICAFDEGSLSHEWTGCALPLAALALPGGIAAAGAASDRYGLLLTAGVMGLILALLSLTGPGLFLFVPSILYLAAGAYWPEGAEEAVAD